MSIPVFINKIKQHPWQANALALISGAATTLAFAPFSFFPISLLSIALLFFLWIDVPLKKIVKRGFLFGLGLFGTGIQWIHYSMSQFGGVPFTLAVFLTFLLVLFLALFPAAAGYLFKRYFSSSQENKTWILVLPALFVLTEWVRGWIFTGFPWLTIGYSQIDTPLNGFTPIAGVFGLSFISLVCSALIAYALHNTRQAIKFSSLAFILIFISGAILDLIDWTTPTGKPLKATLVQGNVTQDQKWLPEQRRPTIELYSKLTRENWGSDLIVWPETALPAFYHQAKRFLDELNQEAQQNNTDMLLGVPVMDPDDRRYYNAVISLSKTQEFYHKQHLVPFGEFIPFKALLGNILKVFDVPLPNFSYSDNKNRILSITNHKVGISICYEDAFGEEAILALPDVDLLVNVSNDAWFGDSIAPHQHLQIARMRAIETGRPMLRATNTGVTAIIDHRGEIQSQLPQFKAQALTGSVQAMTGSTPYVMLGNWLVVSSALLILIAAARIQLKSKPKQ